MIERSPLAALRHVSSALDREGRAFAVVGGLAVTVRSEVRFTRDVDIALVADDDADAERLIFALRAEGYSIVARVEHEATHRLATARLRGPGSTLCDLLFASSGIEAEVVARATQTKVSDGFSLAVARVEELIALKVLSAAPKRPQDELDILRLVEFNPTFDDESVRRNLELVTSRGYARGEDLLKKYAVCMSRVREALG